VVENLILSLSKDEVFVSGLNVDPPWSDGMTGLKVSA
jgi:hypothetical protein